MVSVGNVICWMFAPNEFAVTSLFWTNIMVDLINFCNFPFCLPEIHVTRTMSSGPKFGCCQALVQNAGLVRAGGLHTLKNFT